jgi:hypothetical protein
MRSLMLIINSFHTKSLPVTHIDFVAHAKLHRAIGNNQDGQMLNNKVFSGVKLRPNRTSI